MPSKPSAASRTIALFGEPPSPEASLLAFGSLERANVGGFPERPGQTGLFGPQQLEIGDVERLKRDAARRTEIDRSARRDPTVVSLAAQEKRLHSAAVAQAAAEEAERGLRFARTAEETTDRRLKDARQALKTAERAHFEAQGAVRTAGAKVKTAKAKAAKAAKGIR